MVDVLNWLFEVKIHSANKFTKCFFARFFPNRYLMLTLKHVCYCQCNAINCNKHWNSTYIHDSNSIIYVFTISHNNEKTGKTAKKRDTPRIDRPSLNTHIHNLFTLKNIMLACSVFVYYWQCEFSVSKILSFCNTAIT